MTVYDNGKIYAWDSFAEVRERVKSQWAKFPSSHDPISIELKAKIDRVIQQQHSENATLYE